MRTSSGAPPILPDRSRLKACMAANTFVLPGIGSIMAGLRVGYSQAMLAIGGFCLSSIWFTGFVIRFVMTGEIADEVLNQLLMAIAGVGLFLAAWIWSQLTNRILKQMMQDLPEKNKTI